MIQIHLTPAIALKFVCLPDNSEVIFELKTQNPKACNAALLSSEFSLEMCAWKNKTRLFLYISACVLTHKNRHSAIPTALLNEESCQKVNA